MIWMMLAAAMMAQPEADPQGNLLINGSFEEPAAEPAQLDPNRIGEWWSFAGPKRPYWRGFERTDEQSIDGDHSVKLILDSDLNPTTSTLIIGAIQNVKTETMPEELSGWVRLDGWERGTMRQYVQIVVIVWDVTGNLPPGYGLKNYQIAYTFGGVQKPPLEINNRKFQLIGEALDLENDEHEMNEGEWVRFDLNPREDFKRLWKVDPSDFEYVRVLYEVRYDGRDDKFEPDARAAVYWDGLHFGPDLDGDADWPILEKSETE